MRQIISIILAGGRGTRMGGELPKACVDFLGRPLVAHAIDAVLPLHPEKIVVVVGYKAELVEAAVRAHFPDAPIEFALQKEQRGTADAVSAARSHLEGFEGDVLVSICDAPRLRAESLAKIIATNRIKEASAVLLSAIVEDPTGYGRIVRGEDGGVKAIVEEKNARMDEKAIREMNSGTYCFFGPDLLFALDRIVPNSVNGELYLTDAVEILHSVNKRVEAVPADDFREALGANTPDELSLLATMGV